MRKCDELTDPGSCLNKATDNEWLFVVLGRDVAAPATVRYWAVERIRRQQNLPTDAQIVEALAWADRVEAAQTTGLTPEEKSIIDALEPLEG